MHYAGQVNDDFSHPVNTDSCLLRRPFVLHCQGNPAVTFI